MFKRSGLGLKLVVYFVAVGLIPFVVVGAIAALKARRALTHQAFSHLAFVRDIRQNQIGGYFDSVHDNLNFLARTVDALEQAAFEKLAAVQEIKKAQVETLFRRMRRDVATLARSREAQEAFEDLLAYERSQGLSASQPLDTGSAAYKQIYERHYPYLAEYVKELGYYDVFLIDAETGRVLFTEAKGAELGANLAMGPLRREGLGKLWSAARSARDVVIQDFGPYSPGNGDQAAFMGAQCRDASGRVIGIVAVRLPSEAVNEIVQRRDGMGNTGETFIVSRVGGRYILRSNTVVREGRIGDAVEAEYLAFLADSPKGMVTAHGRGGGLEVVAYEPLEIEGVSWTIVSSISLEEAIVPGVGSSEGDYFADFIKEFGFYDLFLIHPNGDVFYTVCQESDYGTNMIDGPYSSSGLGRLVRSVLEERDFGFADFEPYEPSGGEPASFVAEPILNDHGDVKLLVALQVSIDEINAVMNQRDGMGRTGETYLVGPDHLMRSDSYLDPTYHTVKASFANPERGKVETFAVKSALDGSQGEKVIKGYNDSWVLSAFAPLELWGTRWVLIAEIDKAEALAPVTSLLWAMGVIGLLGVAAVVAVALWVARMVANPIKLAIENLANSAEQLSLASGQVSQSSQQMADGASEQASALEDVSSSLEEMASMTKKNAENTAEANGIAKENAKMAREASELAGQMHEAAENSRQTMERMVEAIGRIKASSDETAKIVKTIDEIAFQTNLLALNAAVEAARAGEAGKGFAVVAEEVRNLAQRSAQAARNTATLIEESQQNAENGVRVSEEVGAILMKIVEGVANVSRLIARVAEGSEKQVALMEEVAVASEEQSKGIEQISEAVTQMDRVTQSNAASAEESASAAEELNSMAVTLQKEVVSELARMVHGDRRGTGRRAMVEEVTIHGSYGGEPVTVEGETVDVSEGGLAVRSKIPLDPGAPIEVEASGAGGHKKVKGEVVRSRPIAGGAAYEHGITFEEPEEKRGAA